LGCSHANDRRRTEGSRTLELRGPRYKGTFIHMTPQQDFGTFLRKTADLSKSAKGKRNRVSKEKKQSREGEIVLGFNNSGLWARTSEMKTHAVLIMGESRVGKSSIIARVCPPPFSSTLLPSLILDFIDGIRSTATVSSPTSTTPAGTATAAPSPSQASRTKSSSKTSPPSSRPTNPSTSVTA
jgi:hypothetical protein